MMNLRVGTRRSPLALWQARHWVDRVQSINSGITCELIPISTSGDLTKGSLCEVGGKGLFSKEIHEAMMRGDIDCAVHSLKDVESVTHAQTPQQSSFVDERIRIGAVWRTSPSHDVLISQGKPCKVVASDSKRRRDQLKILMPDVEFVGARGNVATRLGLVGGQVDGTILALAGLERLGLWTGGDRCDAPFEHLFATILTDMVPAAGQGVIAVDAADDKILEVVATAHDSDCWRHCFVERRVLQLLRADCHTSIGLEAKENGVRWFYRGRFGFFHHTPDLEITAQNLALYLGALTESS